MDTALSPVTDLRSRASLSMNPAWPIWLKTGGDEFVSSLLAFSFACLIDSDMLVRALLTVFAVLLLGEVVLATRDWSAPYILTPQRYKNLSISRHPASLDRRRVWDGIGRLMSRQSQCDKGSSVVCPFLQSIKFVLALTRERAVPQWGVLPRGWRLLLLCRRKSRLSDGI